MIATKSNIVDESERIASLHLCNRLAILSDLSTLMLIMAIILKSIFKLSFPTDVSFLEQMVNFYRHGMRCWGY